MQVNRQTAHRNRQRKIQQVPLCPELITARVARLTIHHLCCCLTAGHSAPALAMFTSYVQYMFGGSDLEQLMTNIGWAFLAGV